MKSTNADIKQLFNAKALASAGLTPANIPNNTFGIVDVSTGLTVTTLPAKFNIISKVNGKTYHSFSEIESAKIIRKMSKDYQAPVAQSWSATIDCCSCIDQAVLTIGIDETSLQMRDGLTWTHKDFAVVVQPEELKCLCSCDGTFKVHENNVFTSLLNKKILAMNSPFYTSSVSISIADADTGANLPAEATAEEGELFVKTGTSEGTYFFDGVAWDLIADPTGLITDVDDFLATFEERNTDPATTVFGPMLNLNITGIVQPTPNYNDLEVNYIYPRGVRLQPALQIGKKGCVTKFTEVTPIQFELGAGYDLRAEEFENMSYYTDLNFYPTLSDGIQNSAMKYQFDNQTNYNVITFEYLTDKVEVNEGDKRLFGVTIATSNGTLFGTLKTLFGL